MAKSQAEIIADLPEEERDAIFKDFTEDDYARLQYDAGFWLRPEQKVEQGDWFITAAVAGRGFGKSRMASEWVRAMALKYPGCRIAVAGRTVADVRNTMVLGESGILAVHAPDERPEYKQHTASIHWPNGSQALMLSSESPDQARGPQFHFAVGDEFAAWKTTKDASGATLYSNLIAATRLSMGDSQPQLLLATTPKKTKVMKELLERAKDPEERIVIVRGSTLDNKSLGKQYIENLKRQYGDTDLARQEINGDMLGDNEGLIFTDAILALAKKETTLPRGIGKIIAVDPSVSADPNPATSDECGIMVIGSTREYALSKRTAYVIEDASLRATPDIWVKRVSEMAQKHGIRNIVAEANQGGKLIQMAINTENPNLKVHLVHAVQGKVKRVEPVVIAMAQGRVKFMDEFPDLEEQLIYYDPDNSGYSPDRMDAFAWGVISLLVAQPKGMNFGIFQSSSAKGRKLPLGTQMGTGRSRLSGRASGERPRRGGRR